MNITNTLCPYLAKPLSECAKVNGEHILASALGTPDSFVLQCDESENQRLNVELDVPTLRMEMLQLLAVASGAVSRSGKDSVTLTGTLRNGDAVKVKLSPDGAQFNVAVPVETHPQTGLVSAVKGFGPQAQHRAAEVINRYRNKGLQVTASEPQTLPSVVEASMTLDLNLLLRFMCRSAYLMTVATLGDAAIASVSGDQYRRAINTAGMTHGTLLDIGIGGVMAEPSKHPLQFANPYQGGHTLACAAMTEMMVSHVVLFGVFYATFITQNPCPDDPQSRIFYIDPATKACISSEVAAEMAAGRFKPFA